MLMKRWSEEEVTFLLENKNDLSAVSEVVGRSVSACRNKLRALEKAPEPAPSPEPEPIPTPEPVPEQPAEPKLNRRAVARRVTNIARSLLVRASEDGWGYTPPPTILAAIAADARVEAIRKDLPDLSSAAQQAADEARVRLESARVATKATKEEARNLLKKIESAVARTAPYLDTLRRRATAEKAPAYQRALLACEDANTEMATSVAALRECVAANREVLDQHFATLLAAREEARVAFSAVMAEATADSVRALRQSYWRQEKQERARAEHEARMAEGARLRELFEAEQTRASATRVHFEPIRKGELKDGGRDDGRAARRASKKLGFFARPDVKWERDLLREWEEIQRDQESAASLVLAEFA